MAEAPDMPEEGQTAPDFRAASQDGDQISLSDYRGRKVALYFYPKDDTPGCTKQACSLRDDYSALLDAGIAVIGVSGDDVASHAAFADKYELPFPLLADPDHDILEKYGVWRERNLYGRLVLGTQRTTFLIDEEGVIRKVIKRPNVDDHAREVLAGFGLDSSS
ncbi:MAG TPA: thioredoxin-dependent thiol peroxidase [Rhodothermales bacterium]